MTNRKNNSILFLTTLGVYLGLVLVGGSVPQVLAHGALTRNFELQDEIEAKDDLDKKPEGDSIDLSLSIKTYLEDVEYFLRALDRLGEDVDDLTVEEIEGVEHRQQRQHISGVGPAAPHDLALA